jgi:hypothetical protein
MSDEWWTSTIFLEWANSSLTTWMPLWFVVHVDPKLANDLNHVAQDKNTNAYQSYQCSGKVKITRPHEECDLSVYLSQSHKTALDIYYKVFWYVGVTNWRKKWRAFDGECKHKFYIPYSNKIKQSFYLKKITVPIRVNILLAYCLWKFQ